MNDPSFNNTLTNDIVSFEQLTLESKQEIPKVISLVRKTESQPDVSSLLKRAIKCAICCLNQTHS